MRGLAPSPRSSIRTRLTVTSLALILVPFGVLATTLLRQLDRFYLTRLEDDMTVEAGLVADAVAGDMAAGRLVDSAALIRTPPPLFTSGARIFLYDAAGELIGASDSTFAGILGQSPSEPGLGLALEGRTARGVELSTTSGVPIAYVAIPIEKGGRVVGAVHVAYLLADVEDVERRLAVVIVGGVAATGILAILASLRVTRWITGSLTRLGDAAARLADGRFDQRVPEDSPRELAGLARSFNQMARDLQKAEAARQATFARVAHDLRTPLGSIRSAAEALDRGAFEEPRLRARLIDGLILQTQYLGRLADDLLRLAAFEGDGLTLHPTDVDVGQMVVHAVEAIEARSTARRIRIRTQIPQTLPLVRADSDRVLEILFNLLDNALSHTPPSGEITVTAEADGRQVWIRVKDTGPGLQDSALARGTSDGACQRDAGLHLGIGLGVADVIAKAHGGTVQAGSGPSGGACVSFSLPRADLGSTRRGPPDVGGYGRGWTSRGLAAQPQESPGPGTERPA
jgi:two-component system sensor histidine kinase BaeS